MHRYLLFTYAVYEAEGGWNDFHSSHASIDDALQALRQDVPRLKRLSELSKPPWFHNEYHLVDTVTLTIVQDGDIDALDPA